MTYNIGWNPESGVFINIDKAKDFISKVEQLAYRLKEESHVDTSDASEVKLNIAIELLLLLDEYENV